MNVFIKVCFGFFLLALIGVGIAVLKNWEKLFGAHPDLAHESSGGAMYSKAQFIIVWLIALKALLVVILY